MARPSGRHHNRLYDFSWKEYLQEPSQCSESTAWLGSWKHKDYNGPFPSDSSNTWLDHELRRRELEIPRPRDVGIENSGAADSQQELIDLVAQLRAFGKSKDVCGGTKVHAAILKEGLLEKSSEALVSMYAKWGVLDKAQQVLEGLHVRNVFSWTPVIAAYAEEGKGQDALDCFEQMQREGISPDAVTFTSVLKACGSIAAVEKGQQIHNEIARQGLLQNDIILGNALVDMYAKCCALEKAVRVLEDLPARDVVSWNALIAGYAQHNRLDEALSCMKQMKEEGLSPNAVSWTAIIAGYVEQGKGQDALNCFYEMKREGLSPTIVTYNCILKACGSISAGDKGEQIHDEIATEGLSGNVVLGTAMVDMYAKCGDLAKAQQVIDGLPARDVVSWNALITGYAQEGKGQEALESYKRMICESLSPDPITFTCILKACGNMAAVDKGEEIHDEIVRRGLLGNNIALGNALLDMYAKCGALTKAQQVLDELPTRDIISWNTLIRAYAQQNQGEKALQSFLQMQREGISPDAVSLACILKAYGNVGAGDKGEIIYDQISREGLIGNNSLLDNALLDMYIKCGALAKAQRVLEWLPTRDVISWTALIAGYAHEGKGEDAWDCFVRMQDEGLFPNAGTFSCMLNACSHSGLLDDGKIYFTIMGQYGIEPDLEHYTCMVDLFGRAGQLVNAVGVIQEMPSSDYCVVWHSLLSACLKWREVNVGRWAFERAVQVDKSDPIAYVLMANIYAVAGMHEDAESIEGMRMENKAWTTVRI